MDGLRGAGFPPKDAGSSIFDIYQSGVVRISHFHYFYIFKTARFQ